MIEVEIDKDVYLPCYQPLLEETDIDIELIWGGRDSGKSKFVAQYLTEQSMALDYFRCLLIKETHESIKDAQWQMIKDTAEQWGVDHLFKFKNSPQGITCLTGGSFHPRGMDNPAKIRSFSNPSHAWVEEGNQISEEAFITIITGLRSDYGKVKLIFTFNPEANTPDFKDFWLYRMFFKDHPDELNFTGEIRMKVFIKGEEKVITLKYRSTHVTYQDNPYVTPQRIAFHESLETSNPYWYRVFTLGLWGNVANDSPWAFAFNRQKHVSNGTTIPHPLLNRAFEVYLAWDFNRNPMTCLVIQHYGGWVYVLEAIRIPKAGVDGMCEYLKVNYPGIVPIVTGDYNGTAESSLFQEQVTHYKLIKHYLSLSDSQIKVQPNPKQAKNSTHINTILAYYNVIIHGKKAASLVFDLENVKRGQMGPLRKPTAMILPSKRTASIASVTSVICSWHGSGLREHLVQRRSQKPRYSLMLCWKLQRRPNTSSLNTFLIQMEETLSMMLSLQSKMEIQWFVPNSSMSQLFGMLFLIRLENGLTVAIR